jgi:hypothetical protein
MMVKLGLSDSNSSNKPGRMSRSGATLRPLAMLFALYYLLGFFATSSQLRKADYNGA